MKTPKLIKRLAALAALLGVGTACQPALAIVGPSQDGALLAAHVVMVLQHSARGSGFCSGAVLTRDVVLTAAHCVPSLGGTAVLSDGAPLSLRDVAIHPGYRADAIERRLRSIDLALIRTATPLPTRFVPVTLAVSTVRLSDRLVLAGYGVTAESGSGGGALRRGLLTVRRPLSSILIWAEDPRHAGVGGCSGDSGGPVFDAAGHLAGIMDWATGERDRQCGALTQAARVAPQAAWIAAVLKRWGE